MKKIIVTNLREYKYEVLQRMNYANKCLIELKELKRLINIEKEYSTTPQSKVAKLIFKGAAKKRLRFFNKITAACYYVKEGKNKTLIKNNIPAFICTMLIYEDLHTLNCAIKENDFNNEFFVPFYELVVDDISHLIDKCIAKDVKIWHMLYEKIEANTELF